MVLTCTCKNIQLMMLVQLTGKVCHQQADQPNWLKCNITVFVECFVQQDLQDLKLRVTSFLIPFIERRPIACCPQPPPLRVCFTIHKGRTNVGCGQKSVRSTAANLNIVSKIIQNPCQQGPAGYTLQILAKHHMCRASYLGCNWDHNGSCSLKSCSLAAP